TDLGPSTPSRARTVRQLPEISKADPRVLLCAARYIDNKHDIDVLRSSGLARNFAADQDRVLLLSDTGTVLGRENVNLRFRRTFGHGNENKQKQRGQRKKPCRR